MPHIDADALRRHVGTRITETDIASDVPLKTLVATFDRAEAAPGPGADIPAGWHVGYFPVNEPMALLAADGLPRSAGVLPPMPLPRRMYAGNRMTFHAPIRVGDALRRETELSDLQVRKGRSGTLIVTTQTRRIFTDASLALTEEYDTVFREDAAPGAATASASGEAPPSGLPWSRQLHPGTVTLFRFSALTGNPHRIHYDRPYATQVEGYPGLVVHGPFVQTCLFDFIRDNTGERIATFSMRARAPLFDTAPFTLVGGPSHEGRGCEVWAVTPQGTIAMQATAQFAS